MIIYTGRVDNYHCRSRYIYIARVLLSLHVIVITVLEYNIIIGRSTCCLHAHSRGIKNSENARSRSPRKQAFGIVFARAAVRKPPDGFESGRWLNPRGERWLTIIYTTKCKYINTLAAIRRRRRWHMSVMSKNKSG